MHSSNEQKNMDGINFLALEAAKTYMSTKSSKYVDEDAFLRQFYKVYNIAKEILYLDNDKVETKETELRGRVIYRSDYRKSII